MKALCKSSLQKHLACAAVALVAAGGVEAQTPTYARLEIVSGDRQIAVNTVMPPNPYKVRALDSAGNPVAGVRLFIKASGQCDPGLMPVYRLYNTRSGPNHRYVTDRSLRDTMVGAGWIAEGYGPDAVMLCTPQ